MAKSHSTKTSEKSDRLFKTKQPQTLLQLTSMILVGLIKSIPRRLLIIGIIGLATFVYHTYLVIYPNGGFAMGTNPVLDTALALVGNRTRGTLVWAVGAYLLVGLLRRAFTMGPKELLRGFGNGAKRLIQPLKTNVVAHILGLTMPIALVLIACNWIIKNDMLVAFLIAGSIMAIITYKSGLGYHIIRLGYQDVMKLIKRKTINFQDSTFDKSMIAIILGMILYRLLDERILLLYGCIILLLGAYIISKYKKGKGAVSSIFVIFVIAFQALAIFAIKVYADDGGVVEAGGLIPWLTSEGALIAVAIGIPPSIGAILGGLLGILTGDGSLSDLMADVEDLTEETIEEVSDFIEDLIAEIPFDITSLFGGPGENPLTSMLGGDGPSICLGIGLPNYWVNTASLNLIIEDYIFRHKGLGPEVEVKLNYNSLANSEGILGKRWKLSYESVLQYKDAEILITKGSGQQVKFNVPEPNSNVYPKEYVATEGDYDRLVEYESYWRFANKSDNLVYQFDKYQSNGEARLTAILDYNSHKISIGYDANNRITTIGDAAGRTITIEYGANNLCSRILIPDGREATFQYDVKNQLIAVTDLQEVVSRYTYNEQGDLTKLLVGSKQRMTQFSYTDLPWGRGVKSYSDARGILQRFELVKAEPREIRHLDGNGNSSTYNSEDGMTTKVVNPLGSAEERKYTEGLPVAFKDKNGYITRLAYDMDGNIIHRINPLGAKDICQYDDYGNLVEQTNDRDESNKMTYDGNSNILSITSPMGWRYIFDYNELGQLARVTDPEGYGESYDYDNFGNISRYTNRLGAITTMEYDAYGYMMSSMTDPRGNKTRYTYDSNNRLTKVMYPDSTSKQYAYDCCSGKSTIDELGRKQLVERDEMLNITKSIDALGNIQSITYDHNSHKTQVTDASGLITSMAYDVAGHLEEIKYGDRRVQLQYDQGDRLKSLEDTDGGMTRFDYDANGEIISVTGPMNHQSKWLRKTDGQLDEMITPSGHRVRYEYDKDDILTGKWTNGQLSHRMIYNSSGLLIESQKELVKTFLTYDGMGQVISISYDEGSNESTTMAYDHAGNLIQQAYPNGLQVAYTYDNRNRVQEVTWQDGGVSFRYDAKGNLIGESRENQTSSLYQMDNKDRIILLNHKKQSSDMVQLNYQYDGVGNIVEKSGKELLDFMDNTMPMSMNGEVSYNESNQLIQWQDDQYAYDPEGNLVSVTGRRNLRCSYDEESVMKELMNDNQTKTFTYDGFGNRRRIEDEDSIDMGYDAKGKMLYSRRKSTGEMTCYIYAGERLVAMVLSDGPSYYYHFDNAGSTLALTDLAGDIVNAYAYSPFGCKTASEEKVANPFTYIGAYGVTDEGENIYLMKRRFYDGLTGRFMQPDPVGFVGGINLYEYVGGNPLVRIDPEGTFFVIDDFIVAGLILGTFTVVGLGLARGPKLLPDIEHAIKTGGMTANQFLNDFGRKLARIGDKIATVNPISGPGWSAIKASLYASAGDFKNALWNAGGSFYTSASSAWTLFTESVDTFFTKKDC